MICHRFSRRFRWKLNNQANPTMPHFLSYLHLSDLHFRTGDPGRGHDQNSVTHSLLDAIKGFPASEPLDFIVLTGDIAFSGQREEYELAAGFCDKLLEITGVPRNRLYVVAGNHDLERKQVSKTLGRLYSRFEDQEEITDYLADPSQRPVMMAKFQEFHRFAEQAMGRRHYDDETWHLHEVVRLDKAGQTFRLNLLCLNSALLAGYDGDDDKHQALANFQVDTALRQLDDDAPLSIGLFHHPFACYHPADLTAQNQLRHRLDLIHTGHLHQAANAMESNGAGSATLITAGAAYEARQHRNGFNRVSIDLVSGQGQVELWKYVADYHCWNRDNDTNPHHSQGLFTFEVAGIREQPLRLAPPTASPPPAGPLTTPGAPVTRLGIRFIHDYLLPSHFTGRVEEQKRLLAWLQRGPAAVTAIQALGGMGKSALARRVLQTLADGGDKSYRHLVWYSFDESRSEDEAVPLGELLQALGCDVSILPEGIAAAEVLRKRLCLALDAEPTLLVLDGIEVIQHSKDPQRPDYGHIQPSHRQTAQVLRHLCNQKRSRALVTSRIPLRELHGAAGYDELPLQVFSDAEAAELFHRLGVSGSPADLETCVHVFAGHPLALRAAGLYMQERGIPAKRVERLIGDPALFRASSEGERVKVIVDAHREHLNAPQQHFLKMLAIHPRAVSLTQHTALLHPEVRDWPLGRVEDEIIQPLVRFGLIEWLDGGERLYSAHPLMKLAFGTWLDPEGSRRAHADWAQAALASPNLAGPPKEERKLDQLQPWLDAVEHYLEAGDYPAAWAVWWDRGVDRRLNNLGYARLLLELGLRFEQGLLAKIWQPGAWQLSVLYENLGQACSGLDRPGEDLAYREKQYSAARETGYAAFVVANGAVLAECHINLGHLERARQLLAELEPQAQAMVEGEDKALYQCIRAKAALFAGDYAAAQSLFEQALKRSAPRNRTLYRTCLGEAQLRDGRLEAAEASLKQARREAESIPGLQPGILQALAWLALKRRDAATARRLTDQRLALKKDMGRPAEDEGLLLVREGLHPGALALVAGHLSGPATGEQLNKDHEIEALLVTAQAHHGLRDIAAARTAVARGRALMQSTGCWRMKDCLAETEALLA